MLEENKNLAKDVKENQLELEESDFINLNPFRDWKLHNLSVRFNG